MNFFHKIQGCEHHHLTRLQRRKIFSEKPRKNVNETRETNQGDGPTGVDTGGYLVIRFSGENQTQIASTNNIVERLVYPR